MNNNGIYGGDRRQEALRAAAEAGARGAGFAADPIPTAFVDNARRAWLLSADGHRPMRLCHPLMACAAA